MISQNAVKYGLIGFAASVFITIIIYLLGPGMFGGSIWSGMKLMAFIIPVFIIFYVVIALRIRKDEGGFISFKKLFLSLLVVTAVMVIGDKLFGFALFGLIDPEYMQIAKDMILENMYQMEGQMPEKQFADMISRTEEGFEQSIGNVLKQFLGSFIGWTIFSLILAGSIKKKQEDVAV